MRKRFLSIALVMSMLCAFMPIIATAEGETGTKYGDYLYYEINNDNTAVTITDCDTTVTEIEIPSKIQGLPVTKIGDGALEDCADLTSVTIPNSITEIGYGAVGRCRKLTSVVIPDSVISIDGYAFCACDNLTSITLPDSVTSIGDSAFALTAYYNDEANWEGGVLYIGNHLIDARYIESGSEYTIKSGTKTIADRAFSYRGITSIIIPSSVTNIGDTAFWHCESLVSATLPDSITSISSGLFWGCTNLTDVEIPSNVTSIDSHAFHDCESLTSITIPNGVNIIYEEAFRNCIGLTSIAIPDSVTEIGSWAFKGCTGLTSITIPDSVTALGDEAFAETAYYTNEANWDSGVLYMGNHLIKAQSSEINTEYTIKKGTKNIAALAFSTNRVNGCKDLERITIPDSVTTIGYRAFYDCGKLADVYYSGTKTQWEAVSVGSENYPLERAAIHYNYTVTTPDTYEISGLTAINSGVTFNVRTQERVSGEQTAIIACYDKNGVFLGLKQQTITASDMAQNISVEIDKTTIKTVKVFIWNAMNYMRPASRPQSLKL